MIELSVIFGLYVLASCYIITRLLREAREERRILEDRLIALSQPSAVATVMAMQDPEPARVSYMDEVGELEVETNGTVNLLGDD